MKVATFNNDEIRWLDQLETNTIRITTSRGVFELTEHHGCVVLTTPDGIIRLAPRVRNSIEIDVCASRDGKAFS